MRHGGRLGLGIVLQLGGRIAKILAGVVAIAITARTLGGASGDEHSPFGQYVLVLAFVTLFSAVAAFGIDSIVIRDLAAADLHPEQRQRIVQVSTTVKLLLAGGSIGAALLAGYLLGYSGTLLLAIAAYAPYILLTSFGSTGLFGDILQADHDSRPIATAGTLAAVVTMAGTALAALTQGGIIAFLAAYLGAGVIDVAITYLGARRHARLGLGWHGSYARELLREAFPLGIATFFVLIYVRVDTILLQKITESDRQVALYGVAYKIFDVLSTVMATVLLVLFPIMTRAFARGRSQLQALYQQIFTLMLAVSLPMAFAIYLIRGPLLTIIASRGYSDAQQAVPGLMVAAAIIYPSAVASYMLVVTRRQRWNLLLAVLATGVNIGLNLWLIPQYGFVAAAWTTAATEGCVFLYNITVVLLTGRFWPVTRSTVVVVLATLTFGLAFVPGLPPIVGGALGLALYGVILFAAGILRPATLRHLLSRPAPGDSEEAQAPSSDFQNLDLGIDSLDPTVPRLPVVTAARQPREEQVAVATEQPIPAQSRLSMGALAGIGLLALAALTLIAIFAPRGPEIVALTVFLVLAAAVLRQPKWALFIFIVGLPLHNFLMASLYVATDSTTIVKLAQPWKEALIGLALLRVVIPAVLEWLRTRRSRFTALDVALLAFIGFCLIYVALPSHDINLTGRVLGFRELIVPLSLFFLGRLVRLEDRDFRVVVALLGFDVAVFALGAIGERAFWGLGLYDALNYGQYLKVFFGAISFLPNNVPFTFYTGSPFWLPRAGSLAMNSIDFTTLVILALPVMLAVLGMARQQHQRLAQQLPMLLVIFLGGAGIALGLTRATILFLPVAIVLLILAGRWRWQFPGALVSAGGFVAAVFLIIVCVAIIIRAPDAGGRVLRSNQGLISLVDYHDPKSNTNPLKAITDPATGGEKASTDAHFNTNRQVLGLIAHRPWGYGIGYAGLNGVRNGTSVGAEGSYINVGADLGVLGILLYMGIFLGAIFTCWQAARSRLNPLRRAIFLGLAVGWTVIFLDGFIAQVTLNLFVMAVLWWMTGAAVSEIQRSRVMPVLGAAGRVIGYGAPHPLKIAVDVQSLQTARTGVRTYVDELIREFQQPNLEHHIVFLAGPRRLPSTNKINRIINQGLYLAWLYLWLPTRLALGNFDVLFSPEYNTPIWAPCARVVTFHDATFFRRPEDYNRLWLWSFRAITVPAIRRADAVLAPSQHAANEIVHYARIPADLMRVTPLAPSSGQVIQRNTPRAERTLARFGVAPFNYILHVGVLEKRKNLVTLLQAFARWRQQGGPPNFKLVLVGQKGPRPALDDSAAIQAAIVQLGLQQSVVLTGHLSTEDRDDFYAHAAIIAVPSLLEGFGIPVLDGFAAGVPVVAARASSLPEVGGEAVLYFEPERPDELAARFAELAADPALRAHLVEAGRERLARYSWHRTAQDTLRACEDAVVHAFAPTDAALLTPPLDHFDSSVPGLEETVKRRVVRI